MLTLLLFEAYLISVWQQQPLFREAWSKFKSYFGLHSYSVQSPQIITCIATTSAKLNNTGSLDWEIKSKRVSEEIVLSLSSKQTEEEEKDKTQIICDEKKTHSRADSGFVDKPSSISSLPMSLNEMSMDEKFRAAVKVIQSLPNDGPYQPSNDTKLKFYGLFKQATEGPCNVPRPAFYDVVGKYKWNAWKQNGNISMDQAKAHYVESLKQIVETMSFNGDVQDFLDSIGPFYEFVNLQAPEMNHIKDKIDILTSSSSGSSSSSGNSSIVPSPINSCPNTPLKNLQDLNPILSNTEEDTQETNSQHETEEKAEIQIDSRTATYETIQTKATIHQPSNNDHLFNGKINGILVQNGSNSDHIEQKNMESCSNTSNGIIPPPTPQHHRLSFSSSSKGYHNVLGSVEEINSSYDSSVEPKDKPQDGEDEVIQRTKPSTTTNGVTFANCKEDLEQDPNELHLQSRSEYKVRTHGSRDTITSTTSGTESEKYYSGDSEPEVDERFVKYFNNQAQASSNSNNPGPSSSSSSALLQGSIITRSQSSKVIPNNNSSPCVNGSHSSSSSNGNISVVTRRSREKSSPKGSLGGLNQFIQNGNGAELILHSTVERLNRDVDHILARLRILETAYATSATNGGGSDPGFMRGGDGRRKRGIFGGLSNSNLAFIVMWPFAVHFLIKLISWWWRKRRNLLQIVARTRRV